MKQNSIQKSKASNARLQELNNKIETYYFSKIIQTSIDSILHVVNVKEYHET